MQGNLYIFDGHWNVLPRLRYNRMTLSSVVWFSYMLLRNRAENGKKWRKKEIKLKKVNAGVFYAITTPYFANTCANACLSSSATFIVSSVSFRVAAFPSSVIFSSTVCRLVS